MLSMINPAYKPYTETGTLGSFHQDVADEEFVWHRDHEDRTIRVLSEFSGWFFQFDNELPIELIPLTEIYIPRGYFHRILKVQATGPLIINIEKHI